MNVSISDMYHTGFLAYETLESASDQLRHIALNSRESTSRFAIVEVKLFDVTHKGIEGKDHVAYVAQKCKFIRIIQ
jgi:hypothetical protein